MQVELKRKHDYTVELKKEGYEPYKTLIMHVVSGAVYGNIALGGLIGWGVDASTGAQYKLVPEFVHAILTPQKLGTSTVNNIEPISMSTESKLKELKRFLEDKLITEAEYEATKKAVLKSY